MHSPLTAKRARRKTRLNRASAQILQLKLMLNRQISAGLTLFATVKQYADETNWGEDSAGKCYWLGEKKGPELAAEALKTLSKETSNASVDTESSVEHRTVSFTDDRKGDEDSRSFREDLESIGSGC